MGKEGDVRGGEAEEKGDAVCSAKGEAWFCARLLSCPNGCSGGAWAGAWTQAQLSFSACGSPQKVTAL